jgi:hypothetical protein
MRLRNYVLTVFNYSAIDHTFDCSRVPYYRSSPLNRRATFKGNVNGNAPLLQR